MSDPYDTGIWDEVFLSKDKSGVPVVPSLHSKEYLVGGEIKEFKGEIAEIYSPIRSKKTEGGRKTLIGSVPMLGENEAREALDAARAAWAHGRGPWPQASPTDRIAAVEKFMKGIAAKKTELVNLLMWEICKPQPDSEKEIDRTIKYVEDTIKDYKKMINAESSLACDGGFVARIRRAPLGVVMCSSPTNYPFNELYTTLIPAILMGNTVILKVPRIGGLCHFPTLPLFKECFPPGVVNVLSGAGRTVMQALMASGLIDAFAFIGSTNGAQELLKVHPRPNRLRVCLGLEAKNVAIVCSDAHLETAVSECILGSLSFNGMRCTAIKLIWVHESLHEKFLKMFCEKVDALKIALPWEKDAKITPLCEREKCKFLDGLVQDALSKGAKIVNPRGGKADRTIFSPAVLFPVKPDMRIFHEEQFGPIVPITTFKEVEDVLHHLEQSDFGQQAAIFTQNPDVLAPAIDALTNLVARVNINAQCQRGPDTFPFTARKDSATATLSVYDALRTFSMRSMIAVKETPENHKLIREVMKSDKSGFMSMDYYPS